MNQRMPYCNHPVQRMLKRQMLKWMPGMISCEQFDGFIVDYLEDNLSESQRRVFERHLKLCPECIDFLAAYKATRNIARAGINALSEHNIDDVPEDLITAILDARSTPE